MPIRKPAPEPIRVAGRQNRTTPSPAFGVIPTFSQRIPTCRSRSSSTSAVVSLRPEGDGAEPSKCSSDLGANAAQLKTVTAAQISSRAVGRLRTSTESQGALERRAPSTEATYTVSSLRETRALCRADVPPSRRSHPASAHATQDSPDAGWSDHHSTLTFVVTESACQAPTLPKEQIYLHPDLSGKAGLSIEQIRDVHHEARTCGNIVQPGGTAPVRTVHDAPVVIQMHHPASSSTLGLHLERIYSNAVPPAYPSTAPSAFEQRRETPSERLKRLYLCPWEAISPRSVRRQPLAPPPLHTEKTARRDDGSVTKLFGASVGWPGKKPLVVAACVILALVLLIDLVVLHVRVLSMRDAYYDE